MKQQEYFNLHTIYMVNKTRKYNKTKPASLSSMRTYTKCITKLDTKLMKKKEYKRIKQIKKKIKDNSRLKAPHLIIKLSKNILKRKSKMPATAITVANRMILKARQDIATHKKQKKKFKNITKDEMKLLTKYHKDLSDTMKTQC